MDLDVGNGNHGNQHVGTHTTELHVSVQMGSCKEEVITLLQQKDIDPNFQETEWLRTPFLLACYLNRVDLVRTLLTDKRVDVNRAQRHGTTPFYVACQEGHVDVIKILLRRQDVDIKKTNMNRASPFYIACANGHVGVVKTILASGREVDLEARTIFGNFHWCDKSAEERAREKGHLEIANLIVEFRAEKEKTMGRLRREMKISDTFAAEVFCQLVLKCDGYLRLREETNQSTGRFFAIAEQLPIDLQMVLCNRLYNVSKDIVSFCDSEAAFWLLFNHVF